MINLRPVPSPTDGVARIPASAEVIRTHNLTKVYPGMDVPAVDRLNLTVHAVDADRGLLLIKGAVPGPRGGMVLVRTAVKAGLGKGGVAKCDLCRGTGFDPQTQSTCQRCAGRGTKDTCPRCNGNSKKTCLTCGGSGTVK